MIVQLGDLLLDLSCVVDAYGNDHTTTEGKLMKFFPLFIILVTLGSNKPVYSETTTTVTETVSTTSLKRSGDSSSPTSVSTSLTSASSFLTSASMNRNLHEETTATPRTPFYSKAMQGWNVPLGQRERTTGSVITRFIIHHTTNVGDESPYFKRRNERHSCPTWYVMSNGDVIEFIDPVKRPSSTGAANDYSVAVETQNTSRAPLWGISEDAHESIAQIAAWLSKQSKIGPYDVQITLDRTHIIGHKEAGVSQTACPGPSMRLDWIVERAKQIAAEPDKSPSP